MMDAADARRLVETARFAVLGTIQPDGSPHLVPCVFALRGSSIYTPIDSKAKRTRELQRLRNLDGDPLATLLIHVWAEDWTRLSWVRLDCRGRVVTAQTEKELARCLLLTRYKQYPADEQFGPVIVLEILRWSGWRAGASATAGADWPND